MKKKVLIVDDNSTNLYMLETLLKGYGLEVTSAGNGKDALDKARLNPPDMIVTDIMMPVMDGYVLCREWKSDDTLKHIPLVFYTATYTDHKDEAFALSLGADLFIIKPKEPDIFMNMLKEVLEEKYTARQAVTKPLGGEMEFFRRHNKILFKKLEKKMLDLEIANQKMRILEERYRLSFENVADVIYTIDTDLNMVSVSPSLETTLGYKPQDFIGRPVSDLGNILTPESFEQAIADISLVLKGETILATVYRFIAKDGNIKYGEVSGSPVMRDGKITGIISVARDITDRKRAEEKLRESEKKYRELYDFLPIPVYEMDLEANIIFANRAIYEAFRGTEEDVKKGFKIWQLLSPEDIDKSRKNIQRLLKGEQVEGTEYTLMRLDGSVFPAIVISSVIYSNGKAVGLRGAIIDITERKQAEEALSSSKGRLHTLVQTIPDLIWLKDKDGVYLSCNTMFERFFGDREADIVGKTDYDFVDRELADFFREHDCKAMAAGKPTSNEEWITFADDGHRVLLETIKTPMYDARGILIGVLGIGRDITERKRAEERYRSIFENAQEGIFQTSDEGRFLTANRALATMLGYDSPEDLMTTLTDIPKQLYVNPEDRKVLLKMIEEQGRAKGFETQVYRENGSMIWISVNLQAVRDAGGRVLYYEGFNEDITIKKDSSERMRKALRATVQAIAVTVETRDPYTAGHQRRVADLARAIATEMNLPAEQIDGIRMAAVIHDLGKISVPAEILSKPTKLTDLEFGIIKTHAQSGYDILKDIEFHWPIARMVLEHHERMDGSGYPRNLKGDDILMDARILAVSDVVEAMGSHRPYRPSLGIDAALEEIENKRGTHYDTGVVDACLRIFRENGYQLKQT